MSEKIIDIIKAIDKFECIMSIEREKLDKLNSIKKLYEELISLNKVKQAIEVKKSMEYVIIEHNNKIYDKKLSIIKQQLDEELESKKAEYMTYGAGVNENYEKEFSSIDKCTRGYVTVDQFDEITIVDNKSTMKDILEKNPIRMTVYREHEINMQQEPRAGMVLFKVKADGTLKKIKDNYIHD